MNKDLILAPFVEKEEEREFMVSGGYKVKSLFSAKEAINWCIEHLPSHLSVFMPNKIDSFILLNISPALRSLKASSVAWVTLEKCIICGDYILTQQDIDAIRALSIHQLHHRPGMELYYVNCESIENESQSVLNFLDQFSRGDFSFDGDLLRAFNCNPRFKMTGPAFNVVNSIHIQNFVSIDGVGRIACNYHYDARRRMVVPDLSGAENGKWELLLNDQPGVANMSFYNAITELQFAGKKVL